MAQNYDTIAINSDNFEREVLDSPVPVLIQFYTKNDDPLGDPAVLKEFGSRLRVARVDLDDPDNETIADFYGDTLSVIRSPGPVQGIDAHLASF